MSKSWNFRHFFPKSIFKAPTNLIGSICARPLRPINNQLIVFLSKMNGPYTIPNLETDVCETSGLNKIKQIYESSPAVKNIFFRNQFLKLIQENILRIKFREDFYLKQMFCVNHAVAQIFWGLWPPVELIKANSDLICISEAFAREINLDLKIIVNIYS